MSSCQKKRIATSFNKSRLKKAKKSNESSVETVYEIEDDFDVFDVPSEMEIDDEDIDESEGSFMEDDSYISKSDESVQSSITMESELATKIAYLQDKQKASALKAKVRLLELKKAKITEMPTEDRIFINTSSSLNEPNFYNMCYCLKPCTTHNTVTVNAKDMAACYSLNLDEQSFFMCIVHGCLVEPVSECIHCTVFAKFNYSFIIETRFDFYVFVQPSLFVHKNFNYLRYFINRAVECYKLQEPSSSSNLIVKENEVIKRKLEEMKKAERASYEKFIKNDFKGGELKSIMSGKTSYVRNKILGFQTAGLRLTLTIDCTLGPHYISIPQAVYDEINLATPLVVVNRAPSINSKCIYIVEMLRNADPNDSTIHLSSFLTDGLHADQDGDDLTVFYLKTYGGEVPSLTTMGAIIELRKLSWKYGDRHNVAYQPRYSFTQYHYLILHMFDDFFKKYSPLWASLKGSSKLKCKQIMDLGCSIYHKEVDDFVELVLQFTEALNWILVSGQEMLEGLGVVKAVVESGAKGTKEHIETCIKNIRTLPEDYTEKLVVGFNKFIDNSARMSIGGVIQFILLYCLHSIILHQNNVYAKNHILLTNIKESDLAASLFFNNTALHYVNNLLLNDNFEEDKEKNDIID